MRTETLGVVDLLANNNLISDLQFAGVLTPSQNVTEISRIYDSGMRAESWMYGYEIKTTSPLTGPSEVKVLERNVISTAGDLSNKAEAFLRKLHSLSQIGIPIPRTYGRVRATLYHDFIEGECAESKLVRMQQGEFEEDFSDFAQLAEIARKLDENGFATDNFLRDLVYDPKRKLFLYSDTGYDFGPKFEGSLTSNSSQLIKRFPRLQKAAQEFLQAS